MISTPSTILNFPPPRSPRAPRSHLPFTMPTISLPLSNPESLIRPHSPSHLPVFGSPPRRTARRISYHLKNRASQYSVPLVVGGMVLSALLLMLWFSKHGTLSPAAPFGESSNAAKLRLYERSYHRGGGQAPLTGENGLSLLVQDEDELIAEDDLFWQSYKEPEPLTDEELAAAEELRLHRADVLQLDKARSLRALIYWLAEGGVIPEGWEVPSKAYLKKVGSRGMERLLDGIEKEDDEIIFDDGWAEFAGGRFRIVMFSKVRPAPAYDPHLYPLTPRPTAHTRSARKRSWRNTASHPHRSSSSSTNAVSCPSHYRKPPKLTCRRLPRDPNPSSTPDRPTDSPQHPPRLRIHWWLGRDHSPPR